MNFYIVRILLLTFATAPVNLAAAQMTLFNAVQTDSSTAPATLLSTSAYSQGHCCIICYKMLDCYGFFWMQSLCNLFNVSAFVATQSSWLSTAQNCNIFARDAMKLPILRCNQSSTYSIFTCNKALDGDKAGFIYYYSDTNVGGSCTNTNDNTPWWEAQLVAYSMIDYVTIYNRQDCCSDRLNKFLLSADGVECYRRDLTVTFSVSNFTCMRAGSTLRVTNLQALPIYICEFEAYGRIM